MFVTLFALARVILYLKSDAYTDKKVKRYEKSEITQTWIEKKIYRLLPSPHADLLLGMTIGSESIKNQRKFYDNLISTNTVHVVVVSGYNVSLLIDILRIFIPNLLCKRRNMLLILALVIYVIICKLQPPVIRAAIMGYISSLARAEGRPLHAIYVLWLTGVVMLSISPGYVSSLSFWLSILSSFGLVVFELPVRVFTNKIINSELMSYFTTSLVSQIVVWPLISNKFSRVNLMGPLYNIFVLWLVPISTILGGVVLLASFIPGPLAMLTVYLAYPFFDIFVNLINLLSRVRMFEFEYQIPLLYMWLYYGGLVLLAYRVLSRSKIANEAHS